MEALISDLEERRRTRLEAIEDEDERRKWAGIIVAESTAVLARHHGDETRAEAQAWLHPTRIEFSSYEQRHQATSKQLQALQESFSRMRNQHASQAAELREQQSARRVAQRGRLLQEAQCRREAVVNDAELSEHERQEKLRAIDDDLLVALEGLDHVFKNEWEKMQVWTQWPSQAFVKSYRVQPIP